MTRPRVGIGIVSGGEPTAEGKGPPARQENPFAYLILSLAPSPSGASLLSFSPKSLITVSYVQRCIHTSLEIPVAVVTLFYLTRLESFTYWQSYANQGMIDWPPNGSEQIHRTFAIEVIWRPL